MIGDESGIIKFRYGCKNMSCYKWCNEGRGWCFTDQTCDYPNDCDTSIDCVWQNPNLVQRNWVKKLRVRVE